MTWKDQINEQKRIAQEQREQARRERIEAQSIIAKAKHENKLRWKRMQEEKRAQKALLLKAELDTALLDYQEDLKEIEYELVDRKDYGKEEIKARIKVLKKQFNLELKAELKAYKAARRKELKAALKAQKLEIRKKFK